jgi:hypothetical protein
MSLPLSVPRCYGRPGESVSQDCFTCFRRVQGVSDYMGGVSGVVWMKPSEETPCPDRLASKRESRNAS